MNTRVEQLDDDDLMPEQKLWRAVLFCTLADAIRLDTTALDWWFGDYYETDRNLVCEFAGIEPEGMQRRVANIVVGQSRFWRSRVAKRYAPSESAERHFVGSRQWLLAWRCLR